MSRAAEYRGLAAKFRREALDATLPNVRDLNLAAAKRWEELADELEKSDQLLNRERPGWIY